MKWSSRTPASAEEALLIQQEMRSRVVLTDDLPDIKTVAGIDVGYDIQNNISKAALVEQCLTRFRLPEPTRLADKLSKYGPQSHGADQAAFKLD